MQFTHVLTMAGVLSAGLGSAWAQDPPPPPPPVQGSAPQTPVQAASPVQTPPAQVKEQTTQVPATVPAPESPAPVEPAPAPLTASEVRNRREAIFLFEGVLMNAVKLAAQNTAGEIRRIEPAIVLFSSAPVRAHGTYLQDYGVFFHVEIPSVIPSVASLVETIARDRARPNPSSLAQPTALPGGPTEAMLDPDAHYVQSVAEQLINAMIRHSISMDLRPHEWLTVEARDGSESPGQLSQPSTMNLRIKGSDLADYAAGRISIEEARKRVQVRGF